MALYKIVYWDICGACNAHCVFCPNGSRNALGNEHKSKAGILSVEDFGDALGFLTQNHVISPAETHLALYNWGEPFLHPDFDKMTRVAAARGFIYSLSTNASILKTIPSDTLWRLGEVKFSVSGFSQASYDKMHGFDFEDILHNIKSITNYVRSYSSRTSFVMSYHVYRFNIDEMRLAYNFCQHHRISFWPIYATIQGVEMAKEEKHDISMCLKEAWDTIKAEQPSGWQCPQFDILAIDEYCNVVQCCVAERFTPGYVLGNIKTVNFNDLNESRRRHKACIECMRQGNAYLQHNINFRGV